MNLTLWGAYVRPQTPLVQRPLAVTVSLERRPASGWKWSSYVEAEGLVARAVARWVVRRAGLVIEYEISFASADGSPYSLSLTQSFTNATIRGFTEISGTLVRGDRRVEAYARLRIDYRDLGALWTPLRNFRSSADHRRPRCPEIH